MVPIVGHVAASKNRQATGKFVYKLSTAASYNNNLTLPCMALQLYFQQLHMYTFTYISIAMIIMQCSVTCDDVR